MALWIIAGGMTLVLMIVVGLGLEGIVRRLAEPDVSIRAEKPLARPAGFTGNREKLFI
jgi:hypothetical protein